MKRAALLPLILAACEPHSCPQKGTSVSVHNDTESSATVYVAFGSDSVITAESWNFCSGSGLDCNFTLEKNGTRELPNLRSTSTTRAGTTFSM